MHQDNNKLGNGYLICRKMLICREAKLFDGL